MHHGDVVRADKELQQLELTPDQEKARRQRNIAIASAIGFLAVLFYAVTIAKLGMGVFHRPL
jgi:hypothetical protein